MTNPINTYPLAWPAGWKRTSSRREGSFNKKSSGGVSRIARLAPADGAVRVLQELERLGVERHEVVISSNLKLRLDGLPKDDNVNDPGVAVYWTTKSKERRCMAIDRYYRPADNLAALAASLEAMRAIERHGGAAILDRAFTGFVALPAPEQWFSVLGVGAHATIVEIEEAYRRLAMKHHPDRPGGDAGEMARINSARDEGLQRAER